MQKYSEARSHMPESCLSIRRRRKNCPACAPWLHIKIRQNVVLTVPAARRTRLRFLWRMSRSLIRNCVMWAMRWQRSPRIREETAKQALKLIRVEYEELPAVFDPLEAMKPDAPPVHPCFIGNNIAGMAKLPMGDLEKGFGRAILSWKNGLNFRGKALPAGDAGRGGGLLCIGASDGVVHDPEPPSVKESAGKAVRNAGQPGPRAESAVYWRRVRLPCGNERKSGTHSCCAGNACGEAGAFCL